MKLSIIILSWNTEALLRQCLESLVQSSKLKVQSEIIVIDNGSSDGSVKMIKTFMKENSRQLARISGNPTVKLIENHENLGFTKGNNVGIKQAKGEYIMLLNSDTIVKDEAISKLVKFLDDHKEVAIVGPRLLNTDESPQPNYGRFPTLVVSFIMLFKEHFGGSDFVRSSPSASSFVEWIAGTAFMARRKVFEKVGGLDEKLFMYMEEVEWFYRANKAGFKAYFLKDAEITHLERGSSQSGKKDPILNIYKGVLYFFKKHKSPVEFMVIKVMLKFKAALALAIGYLSNNTYLKETYGQAIKIS